MRTFPGILLAPVRRLLAAAFFAALALATSADGVGAQNFDLSTNNVTVDLSVIEDSGVGPAPGWGYSVPPSRSGPGYGLLVPGRKSPKSKLHVTVPRGAVKGRIKLRPPGAKKKKPARRVARKKPRKAKPAVKKPSVPAVTKAKPPESPAMAKETPKPAEPAKPVAKGEPPAPPPAVAKPVVKKAAPPPPPASTPPAAPPATATAEKPKPEPAAKEQAALPPPAEILKTGRALQVKFGPKASKLPADAKDDLKALAKKLKDKENLRLQLMAFAGGKELSPSKARRMSLSRALSVRSFLIESGMRSTRIDVRALGSKTTEDPVNRVDVNIVER